MIVILIQKQKKSKQNCVVVPTETETALFVWPLNFSQILLMLIIISLAGCCCWSQCKGNLFPFSIVFPITNAKYKTNVALQICWLFLFCCKVFLVENALICTLWVSWHDLLAQISIFSLLNNMLIMMFWIPWNNYLQTCSFLSFFHFSQPSKFNEWH